MPSLDSSQFTQLRKHSVINNFSNNNLKGRKGLGAIAPNYHALPYINTPGIGNIDDIVSRTIAAKNNTLLDIGYFLGYQTDGFASSICLTPTGGIYLIMSGLSPLNGIPGGDGGAFIYEPITKKYTLCKSGGLYSNLPITGAVSANNLIYGVYAFIDDGQHDISNIGQVTGKNCIYSYIPYTSKYTVFASGFSKPVSITYGDSYFYVLNGGDGTVSKVDSSGSIVDLSFATGFSNATCIINNPNDGYLYVLDGDSTLKKISPSGDVTTVASIPNRTSEMCLANTGNIYVQTTIGSIYKVIPSTGNVELWFAPTKPLYAIGTTIRSADYAWGIVQGVDGFMYTCIQGYGICIAPVLVT